MIHCGICNASVPDAETAIADGWIPSYWKRHIEQPHPACPECQSRWLVEIEGEMVLRGTEDDGLDDGPGPGVETGIRGDDGRPM